MEEIEIKLMYETPSLEELYIDSAVVCGASGDNEHLVDPESDTPIDNVDTDI